MGEERLYSCNSTIDSYEVEAQLVPEQDGPKCKGPGDPTFTYCLSTVIIKVAKERSEEIPPVAIDGPLHDYTARGNYMMTIAREYEKVAEKAIARIARYFKYQLHQPLLSEIVQSRQCLLSPVWFDETGNEIRAGYGLAVGNLPPGMAYRDFGIIAFTDDQDCDLQGAFVNEITPALYEEILADAQAAIYQKNYRRAVLEMAMACELKIKQIYFSKETAAGRAFEFMEDQRRVSMDITDYIHGVAKYALGENFETATSKADYENLRHLFRGRNKIAHRGELVFRDDKGKEHRIDRAVLARWWVSIERLLDWLNGITSVGATN